MNDDIKDLAQRYLSEHSRNEYVLPPVDGEHVDYSLSNFLALNPEWEGAPEAMYAWCEWMRRAGDAHIAYVPEHMPKGDIPF